MHFDVVFFANTLRDIDKKRKIKEERNYVNKNKNTTKTSVEP